MNEDKIHCLMKTKEYEFDYWDCDRRYLYGGSKFIEGRRKPVALASARETIKPYVFNHFRPRSIAFNSRCRFSAVRSTVIAEDAMNREKVASILAVFKFPCVHQKAIE